MNTEHMKSKLILIKGDITKQETDAMVNAANSSLMGGGGVDGAIHRAGGRQILEECIEIRNKHGICKTGEAVITSGGLLKARYVIHTVGPIWLGGNDNEDKLLADCYTSSLKLAEENNIKTISFPNISTGVYGFPKQQAAVIAINAVKDYLQHSTSIDNIIFVCFDDENYRIYSELL